MGKFVDEHELPEQFGPSKTVREFNDVEIAMQEEVSHLHDTTGYTKIIQKKTLKKKMIESDKVQIEEEREIEANVDKEVKEGVKAGGMPLSQYTILTSHRRSLAHQLHVVHHENCRITEDLSEYLRILHHDDYHPDFGKHAHMENVSGHVHVRIFRANFLRNPDDMSRHEKCLAKHVVNVSIENRPLSDFTSRFTTHAIKEIRHPEWNYDGHLYGYIEGDSLMLTIYDVCGLKTVCSGLIHPDQLKDNTFEGEVELKHHGRKPSMFPETQLLVRVDITGALPFMGRRLMRLSQSSAEGTTEEPRLDILAMQDASSSSITHAESMSHALSHAERLDFQQAIGNDAEAVENHDGEESEHETDDPVEAQERLQHQAQLLVTARMQMEKEIDDMEEELKMVNIMPLPQTEKLLAHESAFPLAEDLAGKLSVLSSKLVFGNTKKAPGSNLLKVGKSIFGFSSADEDDLPEKGDAQVQTESHVDSKQLNKLKADAQSTKFQLKEVKLETEALRSEIESLHLELEGMNKGFNRMTSPFNSL